MLSPSTFIRVSNNRMSAAYPVPFNDLVHLESHALLWHWADQCMDSVSPSDQRISTNTNTSTSTHKRRKTCRMDQQRPSMDKPAGPPSSSGLSGASQRQQPELTGPPMPTFQLSYEDISIHGLEQDLHHLQDEYATIEIILNSLRNAYPSRPLDNAPEELLDEVDRELSIAYDDVKAQVRQLARNIYRLEEEIEPFLPRTPVPTSLSVPSDPLNASAASRSLAPGDDEPPPHPH